MTDKQIEWAIRIGALTLGTTLVTGGFALIGPWTFFQVFKGIGSLFMVTLGLILVAASFDKYDN